MDTLMKTAPNTLLKIDKAPQTLRDIVQDRMRTAIIEGHFAPGERLVERPLCEQLGVSRTVIRETIRFLEAEGLVDIIPNRGPIVARLDWHQAKQIYDIRRQLEGSAVAACAENHSDAFARKLTSALRGIQATIDDTTWNDLLRATTHFYEVIFEQADHAVAWEIVQRLNGRISRLRALTLAAKDRHSRRHTQPKSKRRPRCRARSYRRCIGNRAKVPKHAAARERHQCLKPIGSRS
jgi:DNA-binding GntR family transcriptional regulator